MINRIDILDLLISYGADVNLRCRKRKETALMIACKENLVDVVNRLIACGSECNITTNYGKTAFMIAARYASLHILQLLTPCCDPYKNDVSGDTTLSHAIMGNNYDNVEYLINLGFDINHINIKGNSYLHQAIKNNAAVEIVNLLIAKGIDVKLVNNKGQTAFDIATDDNDLKSLIRGV